MGSDLLFIQKTSFEYRTGILNFAGTVIFARLCPTPPARQFWLEKPRTQKDKESRVLILEKHTKKANQEKIRIIIQ